jgi:hypothetical protein
MAINKFGPLALVYPNGAPVADEPIEVVDFESGALAALFTSISGSVSLPNPTTTDALGMLEFFAEEGAYVLEVLESGFKMTVVVYPPDTGGSGEVGEVKNQTVPSASWNFTHGLGRIPTVATYLDSGEEVETDIIASPTEVTAVWPLPVAGKLVLT